LVQKFPARLEGLHTQGPKKEGCCFSLKIEVKGKTHPIIIPRLKSGYVNEAARCFQLYYFPLRLKGRQVTLLLVPGGIAEYKPGNLI
jgi:hypothetical protein